MINHKFASKKNQIDCHQCESIKASISQIRN